jgi:hypothetical protein
MKSIELYHTIMCSIVVLTDEVNYGLIYEILVWCELFLYIDDVSVTYCVGVDVMGKSH